MSTLFRIHYRTHFGDFISIRGSHQGLSWEQGIEATWISEGDEDVWIVSLPFQRERKERENDLIHFKPLINDEVWAKGVDYIVSPGGVIDIYPSFFATQGHVFKTTFYSVSLKNERKLAIYLPPSYHENTFKYYPLLLFQDGHNLFDPADSYCGDTWQLTETLDDLSLQGNICEYIVVGIYPLDREWEYLPTQCGGVGGGADQYLDSLTYELRPYISRNLRVQSKNSAGEKFESSKTRSLERVEKFEPCAIAGSSYGGNIALYAWATRPHEFDLCGSFSPALKYDNKVIIEIVKQNLMKRPENHKLYMDCGTIKDQYKAVIELAEHLFRNGPLEKEQFSFVVAKGHEHTERHWAIRAPFALSFLLSDPLRAPFCDESESDNESEMSS